MVSMSAVFAAGVDAAVDGGSGFEDASYMFRETQYLRFQWVGSAAEPRAEPAAPIQGTGPGSANCSSWPRSSPSP
jgi:hypothetical protein